MEEMEIEIMNWLIIDDIIKNALKEDIPNTDITTSVLVTEDSNCSVELISKEDGILAGSLVFKRVFTLLGDVTVSFNRTDGDRIKKNEVIALIKGNTRNVLMGERVALNLLQIMCGIASLTNLYTDKLKGTSAKLVDTRKTTPNLKILEKYAVTMGGGTNHRYNLSDGILIKDNHIDAAGGIKNAINKVRESSSFVRKIEVETENLDMVKEALDCNADIIMLDNMSLDEMKTAVDLINKKAIVEASGNISLDNIRDVALTGVDLISVGALTHSYKSFDISMKNLKILND
jgi:nicotinate-nucleotide pyrophosphorylase (carboxylating)